MKWMFLGIILSVNNLLLAQLTESLFMLDGESIECDLYFSENGSYSISFWDDYVEGNVGYVFSFGKYSMKNDTILLLDEVHLYRILLSHSSPDTFRVIFGFHWLVGKNFVLSQYSHDDMFHVYKDLSYMIDPMKIRTERAIYQYFDNDILSLNIGEYTEFVQNQFILSLSADCSYKLQYNMDSGRCNISNGVWKRNGNELILSDTTLRHSFYMLIGENKLISKLLPGDYYGVTLHYQNK